MAENTGTEIATVPASPTEVKKTKKAAAGSAKKPKVKPNHPPTSDMVNNAIKNLKERGGSSLSAIKKYLAANYKVDADKLAPFIKKYLKSAVTSGTLIQTKGKGASGSFKLSTSVKAKGETVKKAKKPVSEKKSAKAKKEKSAKTAGAKKAAAVDKKEKKKVGASVAKSAKSGTIKAKTLKQKPTKPSKAAVKTPKAPKPKKAASPAKKAAAKGKKPAASKK